VVPPGHQHDRVGEHSVVVWKLVWVRPRLGDAVELASRSGRAVSAIAEYPTFVEHDVQQRSECPSERFGWV